MKCEVIFQEMLKQVEAVERTSTTLMKKDLDSSEAPSLAKITDLELVVDSYLSHEINYKRN